MTSSPWVDKKSKPRMGLYTAASKKVTVALPENLSAALSLLN